MGKENKNNTYIKKNVLKIVFKTSKFLKYERF